MKANESAMLRRLMDRVQISDALCLYCRGVDRKEWDLVREAYHPGAYDDHGEYKGDVEGMIAHVAARHASIKQCMHFLGNMLIEFTGEQSAVVETSFVRCSLQMPEQGTGQATGSDVWGRYIDNFECRDEKWKIARRVVVFESVQAWPVTSPAPDPQLAWASRDRSDPIWVALRGAGVRTAAE